MMEWALALAAFLAGGALAWVLSAARAKARSAGAEAREAELRAQLVSAKEEITALAARLTQAETSRAAAETRAAETEKNLAGEKALLEEAKAKLAETFKSLAADALAGNNTGFLVLAEEKFRKLQEDAAGALAQLVTPLRETLAAYQQESQELERRRLLELGSVGDQLRSLQTETARLVNALRSPQARGRWGEMTLRRVAELAGMSVHCDFTEQETAAGEGRLRPDMIVRLPAGRVIVVDSKVPLDGFLDAMGALSDEDREAALARYTAQVNRHVSSLSSKEYWEQFPAAPEFVVLFMPNDTFFGVAAERDPGLLQTALTRKVVIATPSTFIALLLAVAYGWRQEKLAESAQKISNLGQELYERMAMVAEHFDKVGGALGKAVESYNEAVGSLERRVLPCLRRFKDLGAGGKREIAELEPVDQGVRSFSAPELDGGEGGGPLTPRQPL
jgi:DNA recombination protein RmuC